MPILINLPMFWYHGDYIKITDHGSVVVFGRSDATLNPGGVQLERLKFIVKQSL